MGYILGTALYETLKWAFNSDLFTHIVFILTVCVAIFMLLDTNAKDGEEFMRRAEEREKARCSHIEPK